MLGTSLLWRSTMAFTYFKKVKFVKCLCLLLVVLALVLLFWSWSWYWSCKQWSWSWSWEFGLVYITEKYCCLKCSVNWNLAVRDSVSLFACNSGIFNVKNSNFWAWTLRHCDSCQCVSSLKNCLYLSCIWRTAVYICHVETIGTVIFFHIPWAFAVCCVLYR